MKSKKTRKRKNLLLAWVYWVKGQTEQEGMSHQVKVVIVKVKNKTLISWKEPESKSRLSVCKNLSIKLNSNSKIVMLKTCKKKK
jgi:hypothetical protein